MSDANKPKRPWFRFHLLTLVLTSLAAGAALWANVRKKWESGHAPTPIDALFEGYCRGWPFIMQCKAGPLESAEDCPLQVKWLILNVMVSLSILCVVALVSETLLRRSEGRKP